MPVDRAVSTGERLLAMAGGSRRLLDGEAAGAVARFVRSCQNPDGGFRGRAAESDLYYTFFGLGCLSALGEPLPAETATNYLHRYGDGPGLDLVHLVCLGMARNLLPGGPGSPLSVRIQHRLQDFRLPEGGYRLNLEDTRDSIYASYLALLARHPAGTTVIDPGGLLRCIRSLETPDGAYSDTPGAPAGATPVTGAAICIQVDLGTPVASETLRWLRQRATPEGGHRAGPAAPVADLLSTACALTAMRLADLPVLSLRSDCAAWIETLWCESGGFRGHALDPRPDCEYTFYALLSLGCLEES